MVQQASRRGAADLSMVMMILAFAVIGGFMYWLNGQAAIELAEREVVEEMDEAEDEVGDAADDAMRRAKAVRAGLKLEKVSDAGVAGH